MIEMWNQIGSILNIIYIGQLTDQFTPIKVQSRKIHLPWLTPAVKRLINKKQSVYRKAKRFQNPHDWKRFKDLQYQVRSCLCRQHWKYINNMITTDNTTSKNKPFGITLYIKGQRQDKTGISILKLPHCEVTDPTRRQKK